MKPSRHIYTPDEFFDLGGAGEHPVSFIYSASEDFEGGTLRKSVTIWSAIVEVRFGEQLQFLDVTRIINESPATRLAWEQEIFSDFAERKRHQFHEGA